MRTYVVYDRSSMCIAGDNAPVADLRLWFTNALGEKTLGFFQYKAEETDTAIGKDAFEEDYIGAESSVKRQVNASGLLMPLHFYLPF